MVKKCNSALSSARFDDLANFVAIVKWKSMAAAAAELEITSGAVSKSLAKLERLMRVRLMHRTTRHTALTEAGEGFYHLILPVIQQIDEAFSPTAPQNDVKILTSPLLGRILIAPHYRTLMECHPHLKLHIHTSDHCSTPTWTKADLTFWIGDEGAAAQALATWQRHIFASAKYLSDFGKPQALCDLAHHRLLCDNLALAVDGPNGICNLPRANIAHFDDADVLISALRSGAGIALVAPHLLEDDLRSEQVVRVLPEYMGTPTCLYIATTNAPSDATQLVHDYFYQFFAGLAEQTRARANGGIERADNNDIGDDVPARIAA